MAKQLFANRAQGSLSVGIGTSDTSLTLQSGEGSKFPSPSGGDYFYGTLFEGATVEIFKCTARSGDTLTVTRAQQGTSAASFNATTAGVDLRDTERRLEDQALVTKTAHGWMSTKDYNRLNFRRFCVAYKEPGTTTIERLGFKALTLTGGATSDAADGPLLVFQTATTTNDWKGLEIATYDQVRRDWLPRIGFRVQTGGNITNMRWWVGLFSANPQASGTLGTIKGVGFRYDTATDGTTWRCVTSDGTSETATDTGITIAASTAYDLLIEMDNSESRFYIDGVEPPTTRTTTLPATTQLLAPALTVTTLSTVARRLLFGRMVMDHL